MFAVASLTVSTVAAGAVHGRFSEAGGSSTFCLGLGGLSFMARMMAQLARWLVPPARPQ